MTKNELIKKIEELGYTHSYDELWDKLRISTISEPSSYYISIGEYDLKVHDGYVVSSERSKKLVRHILDYLDTPIEKREEISKYYLKVPFIQGIPHYLALDVEYGSYFLSCDKFVNEKYKKQFTQKEIEERELNFFIKEEVK